MYILWGLGGRKHLDSLLRIHGLSTSYPLVEIKARQLMVTIYRRDQN